MNSLTPVRSSTINNQKELELRMQIILCALPPFNLKLLVSCKSNATRNCKQCITSYFKQVLKGKNPKKRPKWKRPSETCNVSSLACQSFHNFLIHHLLPPPCPSFLSKHWQPNNCNNFYTGGSGRQSLQATPFDMAQRWQDIKERVLSA